MFNSNFSYIFYFEKSIVGPSRLKVRTFAFHAENTGSIPVWVIGQVAERLKAVVLKTIKYFYFMGSNPILPYSTLIYLCLYFVLLFILVGQCQSGLSRQIANLLNSNLILFQRFESFLVRFNGLSRLAILIFSTNICINI